MQRFLIAAAGFAALVVPSAFTQTSCKGTALTGTVRDSTQALVPGAELTLDGSLNETSGSDGRFRFACVGNGDHKLAAAAEGFAKREVAVKTPRTGLMDVLLDPAAVETQVNVSGDLDVAESSTSSGPTSTIGGKELQALADDPDDLLRELQQMAAASGGANTTIAVDGFQGTSSLPPKSSIAYIKVNPDLFSAEYREPPFDGGRVEIYTKPGQKAYHGALFATNGSPWENARDPFSTSKAALGKQRYGFELNGPVRKTGSDFAMTLEHRSIDNFAVVNAVTLDGAGNQESTIANVATPQRLWLGTARVSWQLGAKNSLIVSYSANVNHLANVGVGGSTLAEGGYDSQKYEHMARVSDVTTASARLMHESRLSLRWDGETDVPTSTAQQVQVAGAFTGGGATIGAQQLHELNIEWDDDAILTTKNHTIKAGNFLMVYNEHQQLTSNFNGTYTFGGGVAPVLDSNGHPVAGQTVKITGVEQYRRAVLGLPGGTATAFSNVAGSPAVNFTQVQDAVFFQDDWNVGHGVHVAYGARYFLQSDPTVTNSITPRLGVLWSPSKKGTWTIHAHAGTFSGRFSEGYRAEMLREDGVSRTISTIYNPVFGSPFVGATPIHSVREAAPHLNNLTWGAENIGGTRVLPGGLNLSVDYTIGRIWNYTRSQNINAPLNGSPTGPRPGAANLNVLQVQNSGQGRVNATFFGLEDHKLKWLQFFVGGVRVELVDDTDDSEFFTPQTTNSDVGEYSHRTNQNAWNLFGNGTLNLPGKVQVSSNFNAGGDGHYNITTGSDDNGDGDFNDRPQYALPGTPVCANATPGVTCSYATRYGVLVAPGAGTGVFPRNTGVLPWRFYVDGNVQRVFKLTQQAKAEHQQTLTVNVRSSNVLNHMNVRSVGGVLGSPLFGLPYVADNGRRVEAGLRYSF